MNSLDNNWFGKEPPILIALSSRAMGAGKSAVAARLVEYHGFALLKFAGPLKAMTRTLLQSLGEDTETIERRVEGDLKEAVIPALQRSCRYVMQRLGTEFGRDLLHPNVWADITRQCAEGLLAAGQSVVIDDMRYRNELEAIRWAGGHAVRVWGRGETITEAHSSEGELDAEPMHQLKNTFGSLADLHLFIDRVWLPEFRAAHSLNS